MKNIASALYIHVPFCASICHYCDFCAMPVPERLHNEYVDLVLQELEQRKKDGLKDFKTAYLGGGSPSALSLGNLRKLLTGLHKLGLKPNEEFSMEWNPEEVNDEKIKLALDFGATRFSLGVQSLNNRLLEILGRRHSSKTALAAFEKLNNSFSTGSCDLMFCLPSQSTEDFLKDVQTFINMGIKHISFYGLTLDASKKKKLPPQPEDLYPEMYLQASEILQSAGLHRYEVSNFAMPSHESKHNMIYWKRTPYMGVGPSAHSYLNGVRSYMNGKYIPWKKWVLNGCHENELTQDIPSEDGKEIEAVWLALRTREGLSLKGYERKFGKKFDMKKIEPFIQKGWLLANEGYIQANNEGWLWLDSMVI
jgi:oxygen-independent coproporphyrinogen-3 oxidase